MRLWRFDRDNQPYDAALFSDTFVLGQLSDFTTHISPEEQKHLEELSARDEDFVYICFWEGDLFPVYEGETKSLELLQLAKAKRQQDFSCVIESKWKHRQLSVKTMAKLDTKKVNKSNVDLKEAFKGL